MQPKRQYLMNSKDFRNRSDRVTLVITIILVITWVVLLISMSLGNSHASYPEGTAKTTHFGHPSQVHLTD